MPKEDGELTDEELEIVVGGADFKKMLNDWAEYCSDNNDPEMVQIIKESVDAATKLAAPKVIPEADLLEKKKKKQQKGKKRAAKVAKRKAKKKKKDDRCTRIAKRKYDTWPSAYASGAVVKCRKGKIWKDLKEDTYGLEVERKNKESLERGMRKLGLTEDEIQERKKKKQQKGKKRAKKSAKRKAKTDYSKEKKSGLHGWFSRQGGKGKSSGWVDCNTCRKNKKTGRKKCKPCGRKEGEKRAKYPSCRPTPGACGTPGKGSKWGKKSEGLQYHLDNGIGIEENIFRPGSDEYFNLFQEVRELYRTGQYTLNEAEDYFINELDIGEYGIYEGQIVPLDYPMLEEELDEAKYKGREVKLGAPGAQRTEGGRARVYVRDPKSGKVKQISFGSSMADAMGDSESHRKRRKNYGERHNCADKKDKTAPGYWSCRATKMFGRNIPGWW
jgi:hypothetical protein